MSANSEYLDPNLFDGLGPCFGLVQITLSPSLRAISVVVGSAVINTHTQPLARPERERDRDRERETETERDRERETERESFIRNYP